MNRVVFLLYAGLFHAAFNVHASALMYEYYLNQQEIKKEILTKDGISFTELEQNMRRNYCDIPEMLMIMSVEDPLTGAELDVDFFYTDKKILICPKNLHTLTSKSIEWAILHETGHSKQPYNISAILGVATITQLLTAYYWGMHKAKPYKNRLTKLGSKVLPALLVGSVVHCGLMNAEERRADNWANMQGDKEALLGGIEYFDHFQQKMQDILSENTMTSVILFNIEKYLMDPLHPTIDSRILKIKETLKTRFGYEA